MDKTLVKQKQIANVENAKSNSTSSAPCYLAQHFFVLVKAALLFLLLSLPVLTLFSSWKEMISIYGKVRKGQPVFLWSDFWEAATGCFGKTTLLGLVICAGLGVQAVAYMVYLRLLEASMFAILPLAALFFVSIVYLSCGSICFVKLAQNRHIKIKPLILSSVKQAVWHIHRCVLFVLGLIACVFLAIYTYPYSLIVLPVVLPMALGIMSVVLFGEKPSADMEPLLKEMPKPK